MRQIQQHIRSFSLSEQHEAALVRLSAVRGESRSGIVRDLIHREARALGVWPGQPKQAQRKEADREHA